MRALPIVTAAALLTPLLTGCDTEQPATPLDSGIKNGAVYEASHGTPREEDPGRPSSHPDVPPVPEELDATAFIEDPCRSLTPAQQQEFNLVKSDLQLGDDSATADLATGCIFELPSDSSRGPMRVQVSYPLDNDLGLRSAYRWQEIKPHAYWEPTEVNDFPAVHYGLIDFRADGTCELSIGIRKNLFFMVHVTHSPKNLDGCKAAHNVAAAVITTIKAEA